MRLALILVVVASSLVPSALGQSADEPNPAPKPAPIPASLYFQIFDAVQEFHVTRSAQTVFAGDVPLPMPASVPVAVQAPNELIGHFRSTPITSNPYAGDSAPEVLPRGLAKDARLADGPVRFHLYVRPDAPNDLPAAIAAPATTFRIRVMEGNWLGVDLEETDVLVEASRTVHVIDAGPANAALNGTVAPDGAVILTPDADGVVDVSMTVEAKDVRFTKAAGFHVRIEWRVAAEEINSSGGPAVNGFAFVSDEMHQSRMDFAVQTPLFIDYIHPEVASGILLIHVAAQSVWGEADLDLATEVLQVTGPVERLLSCEKDNTRSNVHASRDPAEYRLCVWRFREEKIPDGEYQIRYQVSDVSATTTVEASATFTVNHAAYQDHKQEVTIYPAEDGDGKTAAGPFLLLPGALLLAAHRRCLR